MRKLTILLLILFLATSVYALRLESPPTFTDLNDNNQLTQLNQYLEKIKNILDGRYSEFKDDITFESGAGLAFGEIYVKDNVNAVTLNSAAIVQVTDFNINGESNNTTPDYTNNHITIIEAGKYLVTCSIHINNNAAQAHVVDVSAFRNNGTEELNNVHSHRNLEGGSGDIGSMSMSGIVDLVVNDTLEAWATTDAAADRSVTFSDITLSIVQIGG